MNSKSSLNFRWSVRLTSSADIYIGIASKLERTGGWIEDYDKNSILFAPFCEKIYKGLPQTLPSNITNARSGDEIHFRFQPELKKFSISLVRFIYSQLAIISNLRGTKKTLSISMKTWNIMLLYKDVSMLLLLYSNLEIPKLADYRF